MFAYIRSNKRGAAVIGLALAAVTLNAAVSLLTGGRQAQAQQAEEQHPDMVYADGTRYRWDGTRYRNTADPKPTAVTKQERPYHFGFTPEGMSYRLFDTCAVSHENVTSHHIRTGEALANIQRFMECDGEVVSETTVPGTGFHQKIVAFRGQDPHDTFFLTLQYNRVVGIDRRF